MNDFVELQRVVRIVFRRWWLLVALTIVGAAIGYWISRTQTPVYQATTTLLVGQLMESTSLDKDDVQMSVGFAQTYSDIAIRYPVLQGVVEKLGLNESWQNLRERVRVTFVEGTQLIVIRVEDTSREQAQAIAGEIANQLILLSPTAVKELGDISIPDFVQQQMEHSQEQIQSAQGRIGEIEAEMKGQLSAAELSALQAEKTSQERLLADYVKNFVDLSNLSAEESKPNSLSIIEPAQPGENPIRPRARLYLLLGGALGLALALVLIFLWEYLDDRVHSTDELSQFGDLPLLGLFGKIDGQSDSEKLVTRQEPFSRAMEAFRVIRSKIQFGAVDRSLKSIVVASPEPGEGKSIAAANLGIVMAQANLRTILVDADFRYPALHHVFKLTNTVGLGDLLASSQSDIQSGLKDTGIDNLRILTNGMPLMNSTELLGSERMTEILKYLEGIADVIIFDSPPALLAADAAILSNRVDGVLLVIRDGKSRRTAVKQVLADLQAANARVIGMIYNQAPGGSLLPVSIKGQPGSKPVRASKDQASKPSRQDEGGELRQASVQVKKNL